MLSRLRSLNHNLLVLWMRCAEVFCSNVMTIGPLLRSACRPTSRTNTSGLKDILYSLTARLVAGCSHTSYQLLADAQVSSLMRLKRYLYMHTCKKSRQFRQRPIYASGGLNLPQVAKFHEAVAGPTTALVRSDYRFICASRSSGLASPGFLGALEGR